MSISNSSKINQLLSNSVPGGLLFSEWLGANGYSPQLVKRYRDSGWLEALTTGVMFRRNDKLSAFAAIYSYNHQIKKQVRIAAHSALELHGFNHYVPMGKAKLMVALGKDKPKDWVSSDKYDMSIVPFVTSVFQNPKTQVISRNDIDLLVSTPEQAFLECLLLTPAHYSYMDQFYIMEQLTALDPKNVQEALKNTSCQRVKRMFLFMAQKAGHYWFDMIDQTAIGLTNSKLKLVDNGVYVSKYRITVPRDLFEYE